MVLAQWHSSGQLTNTVILIFNYFAKQFIDKKAMVA